MTPKIPHTIDDLLVDRDLAARWSTEADVLDSACHWLWFREHAQSAVLTLAPRLGCSLTVELQTLAARFYRWTGGLAEATGEFRRLDPSDYARHVFGRLLASLLGQPPVSCGDADGRLECAPQDALQAWCARPAALSLTRLCLTLLDASLRQSGHGALVLAPEASERSAVLSFFENSRDQADVCSFFDAFTGAQPLWAPHWAIGDRPAMQEARKRQDTAR